MAAIEMRYSMPGMNVFSSAQFSIPMLNFCDFSQIYLIGHLFFEIIFYFLC